MDPDEIANRFSRAFPDATFEVRQPDIDDDYHYEINVINGPLDRDDRRTIRDRLRNSRN